MARMVCVWLPNWPLQRLRHERPELRGRSVVLFSNAGNRGPRVVAYDSGQRAAGSRQDVAAGMPLAEAEALLAGQTDSNVHIEPHEPAADVAGLRELARTCEPFSPLFGIEESQPPECVQLDVVGCAHLFGGEQFLSDAIAQDFRQRDFQVRVALAPTIGSAWAAAHCLAKPDRQPVLTHDMLDQTLATLPVAALRLPPSIVETLHELGLRRIGQVRALPRTTLPSRFGPELLHRLDQAFGNAPELLVPETPPEPIAATWVTDEPLTDRESLKILCRQLLDELLGRLKPRREGVRQLLAQAKGTAARPIEWVINLVSPSDDARHLRELLSLQIDRADLPESISFVRLEATAVASLATRQRDLFGLEPDSDSHREVSTLLDRLSNRLGPTSVTHATLVPDAQPELTVTHTPCEEKGSGLFSQKRVLTPFRPLRLFAPPQRIETGLDGPDGAPLQFRWNRREHRVIRSWGPERIETGWWRDAAICRDYFRVETQTGRQFWLFRSFEESAWFIHGTFE